MRFPVSSAALNTAPPAIVEQAKDWRYYQQAILNSEENTGKLYREYKESGAWKEQYKTWADACVPLGKPRRTVDAIIAKEVFIRQELPNVDDKKEQKALSQVEKAREVKAPKPEEKEEEPEKPAVHSADEVKPETNGHAKKEKPVLDASGFPIPKNLLLVRERRDEVKKAAECASYLKCLFERIQNESDPLFLHVKGSGNVQTFMNGASTMQFTLNKCMPDVVCPQCEGKTDNCHYCYGSGWISQTTWNREWVKSNDRIKLAEVSRRDSNR